MEGCARDWENDAGFGGPRSRAGMGGNILKLSANLLRTTDSSASRIWDTLKHCAIMILTNSRTAAAQNQVFPNFWKMRLHTKRNSRKLVQAHCIMKMPLQILHCDPPAQPQTPIPKTIKYTKSSSKVGFWGYRKSIPKVGQKWLIPLKNVLFSYFFKLLRSKCPKPTFELLLAYFNCFGEWGPVAEQANRKSYIWIFLEYFTGDRITVPRASVGCSIHLP